jgi:DNA-binding transcriptional MocR family regulator
LIGNVLLDKHDKIIMENPTYPRAYKLFKSLKARIIPVVSTVRVLILIQYTIKT